MLVSECEREGERKRKTPPVGVSSSHPTLRKFKRGIRGETFTQTVKFFSEDKHISPATTAVCEENFGRGEGEAAASFRRREGAKETGESTVEGDVLLRLVCARV